MALWKLDGQEDVLYRNRCFASLTKKFSIWWDDLKTSGRLFLMKILYMWTHSDIATLLCLESDLQLSYYLRGGRLHVQWEDEWLDTVCVVRPCVNANVSTVDISICISYFSYIIAFVLYTFKETSLYGNACSGALL